MIRGLIVRPAAERDLRQAYRWYEDKATGLGGEFLRCVDAVFAQILRHPAIYPQVHGLVRRGLIRRFPYGVFYLIEDGRIAVLAVLHTRRDPRRWPTRFSSA